MRDLAVRWRVGLHERVCDRIEPWRLGAAVWTHAVPDYYDFNCLRLERPDPGASAEALAREADAIQAGLGHRKIEVFDHGLGARLQPGFAALGWHATHLVFMVHRGPPPADGIHVEDVEAPATRELRLEWTDDFTREEVEAHLPAQERIAALLGERSLVVRGEHGSPIAYATYLVHERAAEVVNVYVTPARRGDGLGTALTSAAAARAFAAGAQRVLIAADADGRPRHLYARLGFASVWTFWEFVLRDAPSPRATPPR